MATFSLRCPDCRGKFPWEKTAEWPRFCPLCRADIGNENDENDVVSIPAFLSAKTRATDKVYQDIVSGSETRVEAAAMLAGTSKEEMSSLKITDLNTRRDAEVMAVAPANAVSSFMQQNNVGGFQGANGVGMSAGTASGPFANAGAKFQSILRQDHAERTGYGASSDNPAAEVVHPNYRRRA